MILINNKTQESWICTQAFVAHKIGVAPVTVWRWKTSGRMKEDYNHWTVFFKPKQIKQQKGFAINPENRCENVSFIREKVVQ